MALHLNSGGLWNELTQDQKGKLKGLVVAGKVVESFWYMNEIQPNLLPIEKLELWDYVLIKEVI
jgi:hypothetical protein